MNKILIATFVGGVIIGSIISIYATYRYMIGENYMKVYNTDTGSFIFKGTKIYDLQELKVQQWGK